ncbi:10589_t:CDS:1, partial [Cetraspora pellucida]
FPDDFFVDTGLLMCRFCCHSVNWKLKSTITAHINTHTHKNLKAKAHNSSNKTRQPTINSIVNANKSRKVVINDLISAFIQADIPLEKVDKLRPWLRKYLHEGGSIPLADTLRCEYLPEVFENYLIELKEIFSGKK